MGAKLMTTRMVEVAKPKRNKAGQPVRTEIADGGCVGLYLIVQPTGARSWALRYRHQGVPAKLTLGPAAGEGALTLAAARRAAADARCRPEQAIQQASSPSPTTITADTTVATAVALFVDKHAGIKTRAATLAQTESIFNRLVLPVWGKRAVADIRRRDVIDLVERIADERGGYMSNRASARSRNSSIGWSDATRSRCRPPPASSGRIRRKLATGC